MELESRSGSGGKNEREGGTGRHCTSQQAAATKLQSGWENAGGEGGHSEDQPAKLCGSVTSRNGEKGKDEVVPKKAQSDRQSQE